MHLDDMAWPDVAVRAASSILVVPVGSTEQHGPHLPVSTDTDIARALCDRLAGIRSDVIVAPAVAYGSAGEHAAFPGTLSLGYAVTEELLVEMGRSADAFAGVLFVSTHGGNAGPVAAAVARLRAESRQVRAWGPGASASGRTPEAEARRSTVPTESGPGAARVGDAHAGRTETSLLLEIRPAAVRSDVAAAGCTNPIGDLMPALRSGGVGAVSANGVLGDPSGASSAEGREILDDWSAELVAALAGWP